MVLLLVSPGLILPAVAIIVVVALVWACHYIYAASTLYDYLAGPPSSNWFLGNLGFAFDPDGTPGVKYRHASATYGTTWRDRGLFSRPMLYTADPRALAHMLKHAYNYPKPAPSALAVASVTGPGLVVVDGEQHKRQRRVVSASFAMSEVKQYTAEFLEHAHSLRALLDNLLATGPDHIDMAQQLARCTIDIIGKVGFDHDLETMSTIADAKSETDLITLFSGNIFDLSIRTILQDNIGFFRLFPSEKLKQNNRTLARLQEIGREIVTRKKAEILSGKLSRSEKVHSDELGGRDLLTRILRANLADDLPDSQRLPDDELVAQITTFLFAGFETTSTALAFTLELLSTRPDIQDQLRKEVRSVVDDSPSLDTLNDLSYLDAVVRESLRVCPPVSITTRQAEADDVLPLSIPVRNIQTGEMIDAIPVKKGAVFIVPVSIINSSEQTWGPDATVFNPDRWLKPLPETTAEMAPFWSHQATFLAGPRACIGYRFALAEMKALLFVLLRSYAFAPAPSHSDQIVHRQSIVQKPVRLGRENDGASMPLRVTRA